MKKFMTAIFACVCASVGFAAADTFNDKTVGEKFASTGNWIVADGTDATIASDGEGSTRGNYLAIADAETHESIYRAYEMTQGSTTPVTTEIPATGLYFDSYVKFTVSDTLSPTAIDDTNAKIAVYAYCNDDAETLVTNLVACAGFYDTTSKQVVTTNYVLTSTNINADTWYRLTIKTFKFSDETTVGRYGFVVYLDGTPLSYAEGVTTGYTDFTATAQKYANNHQLLPSLQDGDQTVKQTITKTSFIGTGAVDDVDWTATAPTGIPADDILITFNWDAGVELISFGTDASIDINNGTTTNIVVPAETADKAITAKAKTGYAFNTWTNGTYSVKEAKTFDLTTYEYGFVVGDKPYKSLNDAVAAAIKENKTLTLKKNLAEVVDGQTAGTLVIDLAGHNITCADNVAAPILLADGCNLIITNSAESVGTIAAGKDASVSVKGDSTTVTVYKNCKFEQVISATKSKTQVTCYGGQFKNVDNDGAEDFPYTCAEGYKATYSTPDGYWTVVEGEETKDSPVDPGSTTQCASEDAAKKLAAEITNETTRVSMIKTPDTLTSDEQKKAYCDLFGATVVGNESSGYSVVVDFTTTSSNDLQKAVDEVETKVDLTALATADQKASVEAKPGLWYTVYMGEETPATLKAKSSTQATENTLDLTFPKSTNGTRGFYKVGVSIKKVDVSTSTTSDDTVQ